MGVRKNKRGIISARGERERRREKNENRETMNGLTAYKLFGNVNPKDLFLAGLKYI